MRTKCEDCKGEGKWLGLRRFHKCKTCDGTGMVGKDDEKEANEDEEEEPTDRFCLTHGCCRPIVTSGYTDAICAGGDEDEEDAQIAFSFFT